MLRGDLPTGLGMKGMGFISWSSLFSFADLSLLFQQAPFWYFELYLISYTVVIQGNRSCWCHVPSLELQHFVIVNYWYTKYALFIGLICLMSKQLKKPLSRQPGKSSLTSCCSSLCPKNLCCINTDGVNIFLTLPIHWSYIWFSKAQKREVTFISIYSLTSEEHGTEGFS